MLTDVVAGIAAMVVMLVCLAGQVAFSTVVAVVVLRGMGVL